MEILLQKSSISSSKIEIELPYSKSISNRLLVAQALSGNKFNLKGISNADDAKVLSKALASESKELNLGMAGTAYRFLTAYFSIIGGERFLEGHERMYERPIGILVDVLRSMGADISYIKKEGYPPLKINGKQLNGGRINLMGNVSSQFISALLLISPYLEEGIQLKIEGELVSAPYVDMTIQLMQKMNADVKKKDGRIHVLPGFYSARDAIIIERDWSSAAFFYAYVALGGNSILLKGLYLDSIQGDALCAWLFAKLGVSTQNAAEGLLIQLDANFELPKELEIDLTDCPDLIPAFIICASQKVQHLKVFGVKTLRIKESDRVQALKIELKKLGVEMIEIDENTISVIGGMNAVRTLEVNVYNDHRMAMAFAPLCQRVEKVIIKNAEVVSKSFPNFWEEFSKTAHLKKTIS